MSRVMICRECDALVEGVEYLDTCPICGAEDAIEFSVTCSDCRASVPRSKAVELGFRVKKCYCDYCVEERLEWLYAYKRVHSVSGM